MFGSIPEHLSSLNHISSPPSNALNAESEEAFWDFMHTDQLFDNFGVLPDVPAENNLKIKEEESARQAAQAQAQAQAAQVQAQGQATAAATLESFIAAFANDQNPQNNGLQNYRLPVPLPLPYQHQHNHNASVASSSAPTPAVGIDTSALLPFGNVDGSPIDEDRPSGAKKLKQMGAPAAEIEEDKRRRNTEASARFRAKKKEREQAVEKRAKDLEQQVSQLIAEKASLENENKLLKAIVLGGSTGEGLTGQLLEQIANKRKRED